LLNVDASGSPYITVSETAAATFSPGNQFKFNITVANPSAFPASQITVVVLIPAELNQAACNTCTLVGNAFICSILTLSPGASQLFQLVGVANTSATTMTGSSTAVASGISCVSGVVQTQAVALQLTDVANPVQVIKGGLCSYTYTITNPTTLTASNVILMITPAGVMQEISLPTDCARVSSTIICNFTASLAPGQSIQRVIDMQLATSSALILNNATVTASGFALARAGNVVQEVPASSIPLAPAAVNVYMSEYVPAGVAAPISIQLINQGTVTARHIIVILVMDTDGGPISFNLPAACTIQSNSVYSVAWAGSTTGPSIRCSYGNLTQTDEDGNTVQDVMMIAQFGEVSATAQIFLDNPTATSVTADPVVTQTTAI